MRIPLTKPFLPPKEAYERYIDGIWSRRWLTNHGPLVNAFEKRLQEIFKTDHIAAVTSGTIGLQLVLKILKTGSEVITTPLSYVATTSAIVWEGLKPVFADIDERTLNIDPSRVSDLITEKTSAILATHVYGNPCQVKELERIASKHGLVLIFDAAHAFGSLLDDSPVMNAGDYSVMSFHATKLFHTVNGGAIFCKRREHLEIMRKFRNFGHTGINEFDGPGINAKVSEFHAAMGLLNLDYADDLIERRRSQWFRYRQGISGMNLRTIHLADEGGYNAAYFPLIFPDSTTALVTIEKAKARGIELRRYFYPALNTLNYVDHTPCPIAEEMAPRICCLPLYHDMTTEEQTEVLAILTENE
jgi:dTDP-4-amino-4,6-dideoxygalactose transaminase